MAALSLRPVLANAAVGSAAAGAGKVHSFPEDWIGHH